MGVLARAARNLRAFAQGRDHTSPVLVFYGNGLAGHNSCIKRKGRGPVLEFRAWLARQPNTTVVIVDEFKTSQVELLPLPCSATSSLLPSNPNLPQDA